MLILVALRPPSQLSELAERAGDHIKQEIDPELLDIRPVDCLPICLCEAEEPRTLGDDLQKIVKKSDGRAKALSVSVTGFARFPPKTVVIDFVSIKGEEPAANLVEEILKVGCVTQMFRFGYLPVLELRSVPACSEALAAGSDVAFPAQVYTLDDLVLMAQDKDGVWRVLCSISLPH